MPDLRITEESDTCSAAPFYRAVLLTNVTSSRSTLQEDEKLTAAPVSPKKPSNLVSLMITLVHFTH